MPPITFSPSAHAQLTELVARDDVVGLRIETEVQNLLDILESNHRDSRVRTVRYTRPPLWAVRVPTPASQDRWVILWVEEPIGGVRVVYVGPEAFHA